MPTFTVSAANGHARYECEVSGDSAVIRTQRIRGKRIVMVSIGTARVDAKQGLWGVSCPLPGNLLLDLDAAVKGALAA